MKHVIRVWAYDTPEAHRIKEGDVVSIRPVNEQSIINVNENAKKTIAFIVDGLTDEEVAMMIEPEYEDGLTEGVITKKRRYNIPLQTIKDGWCSDLDLKKVRNPDDTYQPKVSEIDATEKVALCKDKFKGTFKYAAKKVI